MGITVIVQPKYVQDNEGTRSPLGMLPTFVTNLLQYEIWSCFFGFLGDEKIGLLFSGNKIDIEMDTCFSCLKMAQKSCIA